MKTATAWRSSAWNKNQTSSMIYYIDPFGCVKNQVDAENMMAHLNRAGWAATDDAEKADLIIVNSCGFIESAKRESINAVLGWRKLYPGKKILLAGCLAQRYAKDLAGELSEADGFFGTDDIPVITRAAAETMAAKFQAGHAAHTENTGTRPLLSLPGTAYVKISEGCDNHCSFCAIPLIRGKLQSRTIQDIAEECKTLLSRGIKELCLISQDSGSYGNDSDAEAAKKPEGLASLLEALSRLKGNFQVRLLYIHPDHFPLSILDIMENDKRFLPYFDIPFQHASGKILKAMNRSDNAGIYLKLIKTIRARFPDAVIRSTFMTGFPGETEEDFELLLDFQQKAGLDWLGCFAYSREEGTPAWNLKERVSKKTSGERKRIIEERQVPITEKQMDRFIGRVFDALVEEQFDSGPGKTRLYLGRLPFQAPEVDGAAVISSDLPLEPGTMVSCKIFARAGFDLEVRPCYPGSFINHAD